MHTQHPHQTITNHHNDNIYIMCFIKTINIYIYICVYIYIYNLLLSCEYARRLVRLYMPSRGNHGCRLAQICTTSSSG